MPRQCGGWIRRRHGARSTRTTCPRQAPRLVHPHLQSAHDAQGLTGQRLLVERGSIWHQQHGSYWAALVEQEAAGPRWVGQIGRVAWLTPFAPSGFHEVWGVVRGAADVTELTHDDSRALGQGLSQVLAGFKAWNLTSFNYGVIGGVPRAREQGHQVVLKVVSRSNPEPNYRSDATYFERLYAEALIDMSPEEVAAGRAPGSEQGGRRSAANRRPPGEVRRRGPAVNRDRPLAVY